MSLHTYRIKLPVASFYTFAYVVIFYENNKKPLTLNEKAVLGSTKHYN